jgi:alpha-ketoglutarate-dependent taurine dioxygenase
VLGATIEGLDLSRPLSESDFAHVLVALGRYGVLRFPDQNLDSDHGTEGARSIGPSPITGQTSIAS